jgi:hypothetical protein
MPKDKHGGINTEFIIKDYTREQAIFMCSTILKQCGIKHKVYKKSIYVSNKDIFLSKG